jgi:hypothetical protein
MQAAPAHAADRDLSDMLGDIEPLALSPSQIVDDGGDDDIEGFSFDSILADTPVEEDDPMAVAAPMLVDPEDISFAPAAADDDDDLPSFSPPVQRVIPPDPKPVAAKAKPAPAPEPEPESLMAGMDFDLPSFNPEPEAEAGFDIPEFNPEPAAEISFDADAEIASFDPPASPAAVQPAAMPDASLSADMASQLLESLMRDMLRPMLKEWLDENLPSVVERMVEKEIARVSRGE